MTFAEILRIPRNQVPVDEIEPKDADMTTSVAKKPTLTLLHYSIINIIIEA